MSLDLYNKFRTVPPEAKKPIQGGRLKGMTDINPMWRLKVLTEEFGPCGQGWYYEILDKQIVEGANGEKSVFVDINLYVKYGEEWSKPIQGTGGSMYISKERNGLYVNDECFKMALTDAISVSCKSLGIGADVYFEKDRTKYSATEEPSKAEVTAQHVAALLSLAAKKGHDETSVKKAVHHSYKISDIKRLTPAQYKRVVQYYEGLPDK